MIFSFICTKWVRLCDNHGLVRSGLPNKQRHLKFGTIGNFIVLTLFWHCLYDLFWLFCHQTVWTHWYTRHEIKWDLATAWSWRV